MLQDEMKRHQAYVFLGTMEPKGVVTGRFFGVPYFSKKSAQRGGYRCLATPVVHEIITENFSEGRKRESSV